MANKTIGYPTLPSGTADSRISEIQTCLNGYFFQMYGQNIGFPVVSHLQNIDRARNSAGECYLHTVEVVGSNPIAPNRQLVCAKQISCLFLFQRNWLLS